MGTPRLKKTLRVAIVSERRADYSRFKPILSLMRSDPFFDPKLIVTGISLLRRYGEDVNIVRRDGFPIAATVPMFRERAKDSGAEMTRACGRVMIGLSNLFEKLEPDLILTGFDIGANFAAAVIGAHMNIPVAHIQGGEITGSIDESLRHAISKFAHIHFPATEDAARRLRRMGEDPRFIFTVGCPSIDTLLQAPKKTRAETARALGVDPRKPYVLIVQHPVTTEMKDAGAQMSETLRGASLAGVQGVILYPNNDAGTTAILRHIKKTDIRFLKSLSPELFANTLRHAGVLLGNSSTGIHETATFRIPTVNVGTRQMGRERSGNVIDVDYDSREIASALKKALFDSAFRRKVLRTKNIYGDGHSAKRIVGILKRLDLSRVPVQKRFVD